jgi:predicted lipoprotein with Yx(FWY)xxD motif
LAAADDAKAVGDWTIVTRDDGKKMWAYKAKPLYTYARDAKAGDATGDGAANGAWKVAVP